MLIITISGSLVLALGGTQTTHSEAGFEITSPTDGEITSDTTPQIVGTTRFTFESIDIFIDDKQVGITNADGTIWVFNSTPELLDGVHSLFARACVDGCISTSVFAFTVDSTGPIISNFELSLIDTRFVLRANVNDNSGVKGAEFFVDDIGEYGAGASMDSADGAFDARSENITSNVDLSVLSIGKHTFYLHAEDSVGNWGQFTNSSLVRASLLLPGILINNGDTSTHSKTMQVFIHSDGSNWISTTFFNSDKNIDPEIVDRYDGIHVYSDLDPTGITVSAAEIAENSGIFQIQIHKKSCEEVNRCGDLNFMNDITIADLTVTPRPIGSDKIIRVNATLDVGIGAVKQAWDEILFVEPASGHKPSKQLEAGVPIFEVLLNNTEAIGPEGGIVSFSVIATDSITDLELSVSCRQQIATGEWIDIAPIVNNVLFPLGETPISCTSTTSQGVYRDVRFIVEVHDTTPPPIIPPPPVIMNVPTDISTDAVESNTVVLQIGSSPALDYAIQVNGKMIAAGLESFRFSEGQQIELVAKELIEYADGTAYNFTQWSNGDANPKTIVTVSGSEVITAQYQLLYSLNVDTDVGLARGGGFYAPCSIASVSVELPNQGILTAKDRFVEWKVLSTGPSNPDCESNVSGSTPVKGDVNSQASLLKMAHAQEQQVHDIGESIKQDSFSIVMDSPKRIQAVWSTDYTEVYLGIFSIGIPAGLAGAWVLTMNQKMYWINLPILRWKIFAPNTISTRGYTYIDIVIYNIGVSSAKNVILRIKCSNNLECMNPEILIRDLLARESKKLSISLRHIGQLTDKSDLSEVTLSLRGGSRILFIIPYVQKLRKILHLKIAQLNIAFIRGEREK